MLGGLNEGGALGLSAGVVVRQSVKMKRDELPTLTTRGSAVNGTSESSCEGEACEVSHDLLAMPPDVSTGGFKLRVAEG